MRKIYMDFIAFYPWLFKPVPGMLIKKNIFSR